jgi:hypothetical protein
VRTVARVPPQSQEQVRAAVDRLGKRFEWGHVDEAYYRAEHDRLSLLLTALTQPQPNGDAPDLPLGRMTDLWLAGDSVARRRLVSRLFDEIHVEDGAVAAVVPHRKHAAEIAALIDRAFESLVGVAPAGFEPAISARRARAGRTCSNKPL